MTVHVTHRVPRSSRQHGFTLIEVLIAVVLLGVGLLAVALLQTSSVQNNFVSQRYTVASMAAQSLAEGMRANRVAVIANQYNISAASPPPNPPVNCATTSCTPAQRAQWDLATTYTLMSGVAYSNVAEVPGTAIRGLLNDGKVEVTCADAVCTNLSPRIISIFWTPDAFGASTITGTGCDPRNASDMKCFRLVHIP